MSACYDASALQHALATKEEFLPLGPETRAHVCLRPTVYASPYRNARPVIVFDVLFRLLRHLYGDTHVTYVPNIRTSRTRSTRARPRRASPSRTDERTAKQYHEDVAALGCLTPTHEPRETDHIAAMIAMNERLIARPCLCGGSHVLYVFLEVRLRQLARRSLDEMIAGARVEVAPYKKNPMDFVLWKPSTRDNPAGIRHGERGPPRLAIECFHSTKSIGFFLYGATSTRAAAIIS